MTDEEYERACVTIVMGGDEPGTVEVYDSAGKRVLTEEEYRAEYGEWFGEIIIEKEEK